MKRLMLWVCLIPMVVSAQQGLDTSYEFEQEYNKKIVNIPFAYRANANGLVEATIADLKEKALEQGMEKMVITGKSEVITQPDGMQKVEITWDGAFLIDESMKERRSTFIEVPLQSSFFVNGEIRAGEKFNAEGVPGELLYAWERLIKEQPAEEAQVLAAETGSNRDNARKAGGSSGSGSGNNNNAGADFETPQFEGDEEEEPLPLLTTADGCNIRIDFDNNVAIVQTRVMQGDKVISECSDSETSYPLTSSYNSCPIALDYDANNACRQYTLSYADPTSGGTIEVQGCTVDVDQCAPMTGVADGCGLQHDFDAGVTHQLMRLVYSFAETGVVEVEGCAIREDSPQYPHQPTSSGCEHIVDETGGTVTLVEKVQIYVDGIWEDITGCVPTSTTVSIQEEACSGDSRYTHNMSGEQSTLHKTYFYEVNGQRTDLSVCVASDVTFTHMEDQDACEPVHNDTTRETTNYARTYIIDPDYNNGDKIYLTECAAIYPVIPYAAVDNVAQWKVFSALGQQKLGFTGSKATYSSWTWAQHRVPLVNTPVFDYHYSDHYPANLPLNPPVFTTTFGNDSDAQCNYSSSTIGGGVIGRIFCNNLSRARGYRACVFNDAAGPWTYNGYTMQPSESPNFNPLITLLDRRLIGTSVYEYDCELWCPDLTILGGYKVYNRPDGTDYIDDNTMVTQKYVCGAGSSLIGTQTAY